MAYGDKRDYPKIDLYVNGIYRASTTWAKTCKEAVARYEEANPQLCRDTVTAYFAKNK